MRRLLPFLLLLPLLLLLRCDEPGPEPVPVPVPVHVNVPVREPAPDPAPGRSQTKKPARSKSPAVSPADFRIREVTVREGIGGRATIHGWLAMEKPGVLAQPRLAYELRDADGAVVRTGTIDSTWVGDSAGGLKRVEFTAELDLAGGTPRALPPRPWSATARVVSVVDAKKVTR